MLKCKKCGIDVMKKEIIMGNAKEIDDKTCLCSKCWRQEIKEEKIKIIRSEKERKTEKKQTSKESIYQKIRVIPYLLALLCFLLPFVTISCQDERLMSLTGIQLVISQKIKQPDFDKFKSDMHFDNSYMKKQLDELNNKFGLPKSAGKIANNATAINRQTGNDKQIEDENPEDKVNKEYDDLEKKYERIGPDIFIILTLLSILLSLVYSLIKEKTAFLTLIITAVGCVCLIAFKIRCDNESVRDGMMIFQIKYNIGYILTFLLMLSAAIYNWYIYQKYEKNH